MSTGFVLISTAPAKEHDVYIELSKVKEVIDIHPLFSDYDLIAKVVADKPPREPDRNNEPGNPVHG